jgi:hypothetical protein
MAETLEESAHAATHNNTQSLHDQQQQSSTSCTCWHNFCSHVFLKIILEQNVKTKWFSLPQDFHMKFLLFLSFDELSIKSDHFYLLLENILIFSYDMSHIVSLISRRYPRKCPSPNIFVGYQEVFPIKKSLTYVGLIVNWTLPFLKSWKQQQNISPPPNYSCVLQLNWSWECVDGIPW